MFDSDYNGYSFGCDIGTMTPSQYVYMINLLEECHPSRICEFGSGVSSDIFKVYSDKSSSRIFSIEHDPQYMRHDSSILMPLKEMTQLDIDGNKYDNCTLYEGFEDWLNGQERFDLVFIDGPNDGIPFNNQNLEYARIQLFDFVLMDKLNDNSVVMYHDSEREVAERTLNEFERLLSKSGFAYSKEVVVEDNKEVIEYNEITLGVCPRLTVYKLQKQY